MEILKDYDYSMLYHPRKANVVADALSSKSIGNLALIVEIKRPLIGEIHRLEVNGVKFETKNLEHSAHVKIHSFLSDQIKIAQKEDP